LCELCPDKINNIRQWLIEPAIKYPAQERPPGRDIALKDGANSPTPVKHMANAGLVIDGIFGQANDRIGVGYTWTITVRSMRTTACS